MMLTMQIEGSIKSIQIYQPYHDNVGTLMRLSLTMFITLLFHLHTTPRVCNIIASALTGP